MTTNPPVNPIEKISTLHKELEDSIADYPQDLRQNYAESKASFEWQEDAFGDEKSEVKGLSARDLASLHRLMFASAFAASATSLPDRNLADTHIESTTILDTVTEAGLPAREFLRHYGAYGNHFTWKLLKLTGRISESSDQTAPALVPGV